MKMNRVERNTESSGTLQSSQFSIESSVHAFKVLSSSIYQDGILAIVRELSCNAYDSMTAAGKKEESFEVHLPTPENSIFYVKDNGTGMSDFQMRGYYEDEIGNQYTLEEGFEIIEDQNNNEDSEYKNLELSVQPGLYNSYFSSIKQYDLNAIGELGLGSKSPYSYTSIFNIESRYEGTIYYYTCSISDKGLPSITLMGSASTEEYNGIQINIPVNPENAGDFWKAARKAYVYFDVRPNVLNPEFRFSNITKINSFVPRDDWYICEEDGSLRGGIKIVQGILAYPLNIALLSERTNDTQIKDFLKRDFSLDFVVNNGDVAVAPSREALSYEAQTVEVIFDCIDKFITSHKNKFREILDECNTIYDIQVALVRVKNTNNRMYSYLTGLEYMWKGHPLTLNGNIEVDISDIKDNRIDTYVIRSDMYNYSAKLKSHSIFNNIDVYADTKTVVTISPKTVILISNTQSEYKSDIRKALINNSKYSNFIVIRPSGKKLNRTEQERIANRFGGAPIEEWSHIIDRKKLPKASKDRVLIWGDWTKNHSTWSGNSNILEFKKDCWEEGEIVIAGSDPLFYVQVSRFTIDPNHYADLRTQNWHVMLETYNTLFGDVEIIGLNAAKAKQAKEAGWIDFTVHFKKQMLIEVGKPSLQKDLKYTVLFGQAQKWVTLYVDHVELVDSEGNELIEFLNELKQVKYDNISLSHYRRLAHLIGKNHKAFKVLFEDNVFEKYMTQYPLLSLLNGHYYSPGDVISILNYIKAYGSKKKFKQIEVV